MNKVGLRTLLFTDPQRPNWLGTGPRPLQTTIWYPANADAQETPVVIGAPDAPLFLAGHAAKEAPFAASANSFPLILISHGTGAVALQLGWLASVLAAHGYIVAGVNHHGNTAAEPYLAQGFARVWERPLDLTAVLNCLLDDEVFGPRINRQRIGAAGFSLGGYTAVALAGGRIDLQAFIDAYANSERTLESMVPPEFPDTPALVKLLQTLACEDEAHRGSFRDERVRAVFAMAPAIGEALITATAVNIPVKIVAGAVDTNAPPALNATRYASLIPQTDLTILDGQVGHYTFLAEGTDLGRELLPDLCLDAPGVDRAAVHKQVAGWAVEFFDKQLRD